MEVNFEDFIGHYKGWFSDDNIQEFLDYYNHIEKIGNTKSRLEAEGSQLLHKADSSVCLEWNHEVYNDATFENFLKYINGGIIEAYLEKFPQPNYPLSTGCKIQKTLPSEGYHVWHCEYDLNEPRRVLAWSLFLNDVEEGGELEFLYQRKRYKPRKGDFLIWPATFTHIHRGNPPLSGDKYIATGWYEVLDSYPYDPKEENATTT